MESEELNQQLLDLIKGLEQEGLVDDKFRLCHSLKEVSSPFFFAELIPTFLTDVRTVVRDMTITLDQSIMDYYVMYEYCIKLRGSATCIGACRMKIACSNLRQAIDNKSKDGLRKQLFLMRANDHNIGDLWCPFPSSLDRVSEYRVVLISSKKLHSALI
uniref:Histidine-containing phosphotransfer protein n=1 Tax=Davidia involucrata TaxID=16924 RepID=A0A5B7AVM8_DAVIN